MNHLRATGAGGEGLYEGDGVSSAAASQGRAAQEGAEFDLLALGHLQKAGAKVVRGRHRVGMVSVDAVVKGNGGRQFWVLAHGNVDVDSAAKLPGLIRTDTTRKVGYDTVLLNETADPFPILVVTSHLPDGTNPASQGWLDTLNGRVLDVVSIYGDLAGFQRLHRYFTSDRPLVPASPSLWRPPATGQTGFDTLPEYHSHA
jgi:hypothetical protein